MRYSIRFGLLDLTTNLFAMPVALVLGLIFFPIAMIFKGSVINSILLYIQNLISISTSLILMLWIYSLFGWVISPFASLAYFISALIFAMIIKGYLYWPEIKFNVQDALNKFN